VDIELGLNAEIPEGYISTREQRFRFYRRISAAREREALDDVCEELRDRYGPLPPPVKMLVEEGELRFLAGGLGISKILLQGARIALQVSSADKVAKKLRRLGKRVRVADPKSVFIVLTPAESSPEKALAALKKWLQT
jgi:transcription-repair coupling factor (superfamily II helicase)